MFIENDPYGIWVGLSKFSSILFLSFPPQIYELHNAGEKAVSYEVDTTPLHTLTHSNYLMPILQCLCAQGEVPPHGTAAVPFIFSPLEAKRYSVSLCRYTYNLRIRTCT